MVYDFRRTEKWGKYKNFKLLVRIYCEEKKTQKNNSTYFIYVWCNNELHSVQLNITMYGNKTHIKQEQL